MESFVKKVCDTALSSQAHKDNLNKATELKNIFEGFDRLGVEDKKDRIAKAHEIVKRILNEGAEVHDRQKHETAKDILYHLPNIREIENNLKKLSTQIEYVKGVGPKVGEWFRKKRVDTIFDLLYFLPFRYEDRRNIKKISQLLPGSKDVAAGEIMVLGEVFYGRKRIFEIVISDGSAILKLKWFNYSLNAMKRRYKAGQRIIAFGSVGAFNNQKEIVHPDIEIADEGEGFDSINFNSIVPVYSSVGNLHQKTVRKIMRNAVNEYAGLMIGGLPDSIKKRYALMELSSAIRQCHMPAGLECMDSKDFLARKSLVFDELFFLELGLAIKKRDIIREGGISFNTDSARSQKLKRLIPYKLTTAQERVISEIKNDMSSIYPMNRLIQGDVGSGKTIVAFISVLIAIDNGYQAAFMSPTEILAEQHYLNIHKFASEVDINTCLLTSSVSKSERKELISQIKDGKINLVIGTHALIQDDVEFKKLGIAVIDEQHKFGVIQRAMLKRKGAGGLSPDMVVMTATPIPRTLTMTVFGDLDVSIIDELPSGRKPVDTMVFREKDRERIYRVLRDELNKGRQVYIVYPLIEEKEELGLRDATSMAGHLKKDVFPDFRIGLLHGKLHVREKEDIMKSFKDKDIDILVSTTVIEVGIDIPNATVMLIEHAERFGLSQLHQLRGRVGRGGHKSFCLLLAYKIGSVDTYKRLKIMEGTNDGFRIAEEDLKIRGPGDFLGTRQSGIPDFRVSDLLHDAALLKNARDEAFNLVKEDPDLIRQENRILKVILKNRWQERFELATIG
ncbi:MAG: ATP-dependent DNA helicase RecG [Deltaproteobacteria bacterium]|nr:ATP-dependent DNA helicase RecG [Deltaproteobacteria bacterium]